MRPDAFVVVVGSGAAGSAAARTLADAGVRVVVVENDRLGGTCLWRGCMPKKALYKAAKSYLDAAKAEEFGVACAGRELDWESVLAWKWHAQESYAGDQDAAFADRGIEVVRGTARFEGRLRLRVGDRLLEPTDVVLACGSASTVPPIPGAEEADTSDDALHYPSPPRSLAIIGGGAVAFEFAGIYAAFGSRVTMLVRGDRLLAGYDPEIVAVARRRLEELGVVFRLGAAAGSLESHANGWRSTLRGGGTIDTDRVLLATGRHSRVPEVDPGTAAIVIDESGRPVLDPLGRTSDPHVWVAGDARGGAMHTPLANAEGRRVALAILGETAAPLDVSTLTTAVFTFPQLAQVGLSETRARESGIAHMVHRRSFHGVGAAIVSDDRDGLVKILSAEDGTLLGAQIAAPEASDLIYAFATAIRGGLKVAELREAIAVHPAYAQALEWVAW